MAGQDVVLVEGAGVAGPVPESLIPGAQNIEPAPTALDLGLDVLGKIWNLPNTAIGIAVGSLGFLIDRVVYALTLGHLDLGFGISIGNNAIQFENHPLFFGGLTLGNAIIYSGSVKEDVETIVPGVSVPVGLHERPHTIQGQVLGPFYLPANIVAGLAGILGSPFTGLGPGLSAWHAPLNFMERGPLSVPPRPTP